MAGKDYCAAKIQDTHYLAPNKWLTQILSTYAYKGPKWLGGYFVADHSDHYMISLHMEFGYVPNTITSIQAGLCGGWNGLPVSTYTTRWSRKAAGTGIVTLDRSFIYWIGRGNKVHLNIKSKGSGNMRIERSFSGVTVMSMDRYTG